MPDMQQASAQRGVKGGYALPKGVGAISYPPNREQTLARLKNVGRYVPLFYCKALSAYLRYLFGALGA